MWQAVGNFFFGDLSREARTAVWRVSITAFLVFHIFWACGWIPGIPGFAMAAEYQGLQDEVQTVKETLLEKDLIESQERFCHARVGGNLTAMRYAEERRRRLLGEFRAMTDEAFNLPSCMELGIDQRN